jgi:hypothetical protein
MFELPRVVTSSDVCVLLRLDPNLLATMLANICQHGDRSSRTIKVTLENFLANTCQHCGKRRNVPVVAKRTSSRTARNRAATHDCEWESTLQKFDTPAPVSAHLEIPAGRIRFVAADRADTVVEVLPVDASKSRDVKAAERIEVAYADGVLRIAAPVAKNRPLGPTGSVEVTVQLPAGSRIEAKTAACELRGIGRLGDVAFESAHASVKLDETASAHLALLAGDVSVHRLGGPARITTLKGDIHIAEAVRGTVVLRTEFGAVSVGAARGVSAALDAGTTHGRIHNALKNTEGAAAGLNIHATTAYGDITARSL